MKMFSVKIHIWITFQCIPLIISSEIAELSSYKRPVCGIQFDQELLGNFAARQHSFPWLGLIGYKQYNDLNNPVLFYCGGVLISKRYVLTAGHCLNRKYRKKWSDVIVRFGEHNLRQQPECVPILEELRCFRYRDVNVAAGFFPKGFNPDDSNRHNDIGLLRLEDHVDFAENIMPICLFTQDVRDLSKSMYLAGWAISKLHPGKLKKQNQQAYLTSLSDCHNYYNQTLHKDSVCVKSDINSTSCSVDSGGPLLGYKEIRGIKQWYVAGILRFGPSNCSLQNVPWLFTTTLHYSSWIDHTMLRY